MVPPIRKRPPGLAPLSADAFKPTVAAPRSPANPGRPMRIVVVSSSSQSPLSLEDSAISGIPIVGLVTPALSKPSSELKGLQTLPVASLPSYELPSDAASSAFLLPALQSPQDASEALIELLSSTSSGGKTFEIRLEPTADGAALVALRDALEDALSKAYDKEVKGEAAKDGVRIVLDLLALPPPSSIESSSLARSEAFQNWSNFISRLSLHPRVLLKLSQPPSSQSTAGDAKAQAAELKRRLRILLDVALEAFGDERLVFGFEGGDADGAARSEEATAWFEGVRGALSDMGLGEEELTRIFADNAARTYGLQL